MSLQHRALTAPDDVRSFPNASMEMFLLGDRAVAREIFEPGWRWSTSIKPSVNTDWCMAHHKGITLSGQLHVVSSDGTEMDLGPNDLFEIPAGHDAWVVGDEPWIAIDFFG